MDGVIEEGISRDGVSVSCEGLEENRETYGMGDSKPGAARIGSTFY